MTRGVVYMIWGEDHKPDLEKSIESLKKYNPTLDYTVIYMGNFNQHDMIRKIDVYEKSPYDSTLFLDADTYVLGDLTFGFEQAERHGMAICLERTAWAQRWVKFVPQYMVGEIPEYNTGVMFFVKNRQVAKIFETWKGEAMRLKHNFGCTWNQPSFATALYDSDFNPYVLPSNVWNLRDYDDGCLCGPVRIWHTRLQEMTPELEEKLTQEHNWEFYCPEGREKLQRKIV